AFYERGKKYLNGGAGGVLSFGIKGGYKAACAFINSLELASLVVNVADSRSIVLHPASTTHSQLSEEDMITAGIDPGLVRFSVGLENIEDIIADIERSLDISQKL
ncbi:MAG: bifunctional O-acetylhomoserine aminocarboxypropyltransferase/cysteine synthase, partial [Ruminococcaceae bacterium]|nr:bifunctional O-acetylhomoserine aminocarboxypropyltransferase/cysteine synthase [Oscillospiraceae bacterium]